LEENKMDIVKGVNDVKDVKDVKGGDATVMSPEKIQELADKAQKYAQLEKEFTAKSQRLSSVEKELDSLGEWKQFGDFLKTHPDKLTAIEKILENEDPSSAKEDPIKDNDELSVGEKKLLSKIKSMEDSLKQEKGQRLSSERAAEGKQMLEGVLSKAHKEHDEFDEYGELVVLAALSIKPGANPQEQIDKYLKYKKDLEKKIIDKYTSEKIEKGKQKILAGGKGGSGAPDKLSFKDGSVKRAAIELLNQTKK